MDSLLINTLKRQIPYLIGGTITGTIMAYYYGFLFTLIVNSIIWFAISTIINKYYWHYTCFSAEKRLISNYLLHRKDSKVEINNVSGYRRMNEDYIMTSTNNIPTSHSEKIGDNSLNNIGSPLK